MNRIKHLIVLLLSMITLSSCQLVLPILEKIYNANNVVNQSKKYLETDEYTEEQFLLRNAQKSIDDLEKIVDQSKRSELSELTDSLAKLTTRLDSVTTEMQDELFSRSGVDENGRLIMARDKEIINQLFLTEGRASQLKIEISNTISYIVTSFTQAGIHISSEELPLQLNERLDDEMYMNWEEYHFRGMPAAAVVPILNYYLSKSKLTRIYVLKKVVESLQ